MWLESVFHEIIPLCVLSFIAEAAGIPSQEIPVRMYSLPKLMQTIWVICAVGITQVKNDQFEYIVLGRGICFCLFVFLFGKVLPGQGLKPVCRPGRCMCIGHVQLCAGLLCNTFLAELCSLHHL